MIFLDRLVGRQPPFVGQGWSPSSSLTATGSVYMQAGQHPPTPTRRMKVRHSLRCCWPSAHLGSADQPRAVNTTVMRGRDPFGRAPLMAQPVDGLVNLPENTMVEEAR